MSNLSWLCGSWACAIHGGEFEEHWMPPSGGTLQGVGKLVIGGRTTFLEFMSIEESAEGVTMWMMLGSPSKGEQRRAPFVLAMLGEAEARFDMPENEFPRSISYRLARPDRLECLLEGRRKGEPTSELYDFTLSMR